MPFSRAITYKLIAAGLISSVVVIWPGSRRGRRLIDGDSLDSYLESLTTKQALAELNAMRPHEMEGARRGFKGVWLCAAIYESQELSPVEKLLLAEIDALTTDANACYASNAHFSNRLGITVTRVDHLLGKLTRLGYILRVSFDGRVTRRVLAPEFSSNPGHSIALTRNAQRQIRSVKNNRAALSESAEQDCENRQSGTVKNSRATYIKKIPKENTNLETTTTCNSDLNNQNGIGAEATEASSSRRFLDGVKSSGPQSNPVAKNPAAALVDQLVREYGLSEKQRQTVEEYSTSLGLELCPEESRGREIPTESQRCRGSTGGVAR